MKANFHSFSLGEGFKRLIQVVLMAAFLLPIIVVAQTPVVNETQKLLASDGLSEDYFGYAVAISADVAVVSALWDDDMGSNSGSAYVFESSPEGSWVETAKLVASDGEEVDWFGHAVGITGEVAIVGALYDDDKGWASGSAYVFERQSDASWLETGKLLPGDGNESAQFGSAIAMSGDFALIGASRDDDNGSSSGSAYIFERQDDGVWLEIAKLLPVAGSLGDQFGYAVAFSGDTLVVGAPYAEHAGLMSNGSAYVFELQTDASWLEVAELLPSDPAELLAFGMAVAITGETAMVGAYHDDENGWMSGSVYLFESQPDGSWVETGKLLASDGSEADAFGLSVAAYDDVAVVAAPGAMNSGALYVFERQSDGGWLETTKLAASDGEANDQMGRSVAVFEGSVIGGAMYEDDTGTDNGSAYVFDIVEFQPGCDPVIDPPALDFGAIEVGETVALATTLTNEGSETCDVDASVASPSSEFLLGSASSFTVAADASVGMLVEYTPVDMGDDTGTLELVIADPASQIDVPLTGSAVEGVFNLNIAQFKVSKVIRYKGDKTKSISITLKVSNEGTIGGIASVTVIGIQAGEEIYVASDSVDVGVGSAPQTLTFPAYQPVTVGDITWTVTVDDGYPDVDEATAVTSVR